jgi:hypothetical protein
VSFLTPDKQPLPHLRKPVAHISTPRVIV